MKQAAPLIVPVVVAVMLAAVAPSVAQPSLAQNLAHDTRATNSSDAGRVATTASPGQALGVGVASVSGLVSEIQESPSQVVGRPLAADVALGRLLFEIYCARCHGVQGEGQVGVRLAGAGFSIAQVFQQVRQPKQLMSPFYPESLTDEDITDIYAYVSTLSAEGLPPYVPYPIEGLPTNEAPPPIGGLSPEGELSGG